MRNFLLGVAALVIGLVVGSWQPRGEVLRLRGENDELRAKQARCTRGSAAAGVRELLHADPGGGVEDRQARAERPTRARRADAEEDGEPTEPPQPGPGTPAAQQSPEEMTAAMTAALDARRAQARQALQEQADLDDEKLAEVDRVMDEMNAALKKEVDEFVATAIQSGDVDRRDMMDFAATGLDAVIVADDKLRAVLGPETYAEVDDAAVDPFSFIAGDTVASLAQVQDMVVDP